MARLIRWRRLILVSAALLLCFFRLGAPALWEPDEGRYAEISREMVIRGDYITPHNNWVRYFEKPPLVYWITAGAIRVLGRDEFAARFQAAAASVGSVIVTEILGEAMSGPVVGMVGASALLLSPLFFVFARFATPDPMLAFFFAAALLCFYLASRRPDFRSGAARLLMLATAALLGLGTLTKGPVALLLAGAIALLWMTWEGRFRDVIRVRGPECSLVYLAITAPWFVLVARRNPDFLSFFIWHEHVERFLVSTEHGWGPWFFIPIVVFGAWPWIYFAPLALKSSRGDGLMAESGERRSIIRFLLTWFTVVFVFFSIPRSKLGEYILPAFPPLAILCALGIERLKYGTRREINVALGVFALINVLVMIAGAALFVLPMKLPTPIIYDALALGVVLGVTSTAIWLGLSFLDARHLAWELISLGLMLVLCISRARLDLTPAHSYRRLAAAIQPFLDKGCSMASYHHFVQSLPYYTTYRERLVGYLGELAPFSGTSSEHLSAFLATDSALRSAWTRGACMVLVANRSDLSHLEGTLQPSPIIVGAEGKKVALINRAIPINLPQNEPPID